MTLKITIDMDNAAFGDTPETEIARILAEFASQLETRTMREIGDREAMIDVNGSKVGEAKVTS